MIINDDVSTDIIIDTIKASLEASFHFSPRLNSYEQAPLSLIRAVGNSS